MTPKKTKDTKQVVIVPAANLYIKQLDLPANKNVPVRVRVDIAENIVDNLHLARYAKGDEVKALEEVETTSSEVEQDDASN